MPLIKLPWLCPDGRTLNMLVNTDDVVAVTPELPRDVGPVVAVQLRQMSSPLLCVGTLDGVLRLVREATTEAGPG